MDAIYDVDEDGLNSYHMRPMHTLASTGCRLFLLQELGQGPQRVEYLERLARLEQVDLFRAYSYAVEYEQGGVKYMALDCDGMEALHRAYASRARARALSS